MATHGDTCASSLCALQVHQSALDPHGRLPRRRLADFVLEYYAACFTDEDDLGGLRGMLEWCAEAPYVQCGSALGSTGET